MIKIIYTSCTYAILSHWSLSMSVVAEVVSVTVDSNLRTCFPEPPVVWIYAVSRPPPSTFHPSCMVSSVCYLIAKFIAVLYSHLSSLSLFIPSLTVVDRTFRHLQCVTSKFVDFWQFSFVLALWFVAFSFLWQTERFVCFCHFVFIPMFFRHRSVIVTDHTILNEKRTLWHLNYCYNRFQIRCRNTINFADEQIGLQKLSGTNLGPWKGRKLRRELG